jgi:hypothetical protein
MKPEPIPIPPFHSPSQPSHSTNPKESIMHPIRNLSILALFMLANASAWALTDTLVINITVTISGACDIEWTTGELQNARTWTINPAAVNFAYSSELGAVGTIKDSLANNVAVATAFYVLNNSTASILSNNLTVAITANGANWTSVTGIAAHVGADKFLIRFKTGALGTADVVNGAGTGYSTVGAPAFTDVPASAGTVPVNAGAIAAAGTQALVLEFITPFTVTQNTNTCVVTITATILSAS